MVSSFDGGDDCVWVGGPCEGLGVDIGVGDEAVDGGLGFDDGAEDASLETALSELGEEAFDGIEPGARGRGEMEDEALVPVEPGTGLVRTTRLTGLR